MAGAASGTWISAGSARTVAAWATAAAWLPPDAAITPAAGTVLARMRLNAPRGLNEPVCWNSSSFRTRSRSEPEGARDPGGSTGVTRTWPAIRSAAASTSSTSMTLSGTATRRRLWGRPRATRSRQEVHRRRPVHRVQERIRVDGVAATGVDLEVQVGRGPDGVAGVARVADDIAGLDQRAVGDAFGVGLEVGVVDCVPLSPMTQSLVPPRVPVPTLSMTPRSAATSGVQRGAKMSAPSWAPPAGSGRPEGAGERVGIGHREDEAGDDDLDCPPPGPGG